MNTQEKRGLAAVTLVVILMLLPIGTALNNEYQAGRAKVELELAEQEAAKKEVEAEKAVAAMMVDYPRKTEKTGDKKMEKIARGTTATVRCYFAGKGSYFKDSGYGPDCFNLPSAGFNEEAPVYENGVLTPGGWSASWGAFAEKPAPTNADFIDVEVTVPTGGAPDIYNVEASSENTITSGGGEDAEVGLVDVYVGEFEVVCFTVTVTATPVS